MKLSIISDEISSDLEYAFSVISKQRYDYVELRTVFGKNIAMIDDLEIVKIENLLKNYALKVSCICSPLFKCLLENKTDLKYDKFLMEDFSPEYHLKIAKRVFEIAKRLNAKYVRCFSFLDCNDGFELNKKIILGYLKQLKEIFNESDIQLILENEHTCNIKTGLDFVNSNIQGIGLLWDPANSMLAGNHELENEFCLCKNQIRYVHVKNFVYDSIGPEFVNLKMGCIDYEKLINLIKTETNAEFISIETHANAEMKEKLSSENMKYLMEMCSK